VGEGFVHHHWDIKMPDTDKLSFTCPFCGWPVILFSLAYDESKYVTKCSHCKNELEIDKEEYEDDTDDVTESYFEFEW